MSVQREGFQIDFTADVSGLTQGTKEATAGLGEVAGKTKELNEELGNGKETLDQHGHALQEAGGKTHEFSEKGKEAREVMRSLTEHVGSLGIGVREMGSVFGIAVGFAGAALGALVEAINATDEAEDKLARSAAIGIGDKLKDQGEKASQAATDHEALATALNRAAHGESSFITQMQNRIKVFDDYIKGLQAVEKAEMDAEEKAIRRAERNQQITSDQAQAKLDALHGTASAHSTADAEAMAVNKLQEEKNLLAAAQAEQANANAAAQAAADKAKQADDLAKTKAAYAGGADVPGSEAARLKEAQDELNQKITAADEEKRRASTSGAGAVGGDSFFGSMGAVLKDAFLAVAGPLVGLGQGTRGNTATAEQDEALARRDQLAQSVKSAQEEKARADHEAAQARAAADEAKRHAEEIGKTIATLGGPQGSIAQDEAALARQRGVNAAVASVGAASDAMEKGKTTLARYYSDQPGSPDQAADWRELSRLVIELSRALDAEQRAGVQDKLGIREELNEIKRALSHVQMNAAHNRNSP